MYLWLILALIFALLEAIAVSRNRQGLEYIAKPAVMVCLWIGLYNSTGLQGRAFWFGLGILLSLAGDVLLMFPRDRLFLAGLIAFLLAHIFYLAGFGGGMETSNLWSFALLIVIAINVSRLIRRITESMRATGQAQLIVPVILYGTVISVMLYAAMSTIYNPAWSTSAAFLVSVGAFLFCASDLLLAWNKFVSPLQNGKVWSIALYHLGQIGLISGVITQFG